jgi:hypothetical protein
MPPYPRNSLVSPRPGALAPQTSSLVPPIPQPTVPDLALGHYDPVESLRNTGRGIGEFALGLLPGSGDVMAVQDSVRAGGQMEEAARRGDYGQAALKGVESLVSGAGALPVVGGVTRGVSKLTTKTLGRLRPWLAKTVDKRLVEDLLRRPDVSQVERNLLTEALDEYSDKRIDVARFTSSVQRKLLPLQVLEVNPRPPGVGPPLQDYMRSGRSSVHPGDIPANDSQSIVGEHARVYWGESVPDVGSHFTVPNTYAHTRSYDLMDGTRKVLEVQSDLIQHELDTAVLYDPYYSSNLTRDQVREFFDFRRDHKKTWWKRIVREETRLAAGEGKSAVEFPTGETAAKIQTWVADENYFDLSSFSVRVDETLDTYSNDYRDIVRDPSEWKSYLYEILPKQNPLFRRSDVSLKSIADASVSYGPGGSDENVLQYLLAEYGPYVIGRHPEVKTLSALGTMSKKEFLEFVEENPLSPDEFVKSLRYIEHNFYRVNDLVETTKVPDKYKGLYDLYDKDIRNFVKKTYGAREITDPYGNSWMHIDLAPEEKNRLIDVFSQRETGNSTA